MHQEYTIFNFEKYSENKYKYKWKNTFLLVQIKQVGINFEYKL